MISLSSLDLSIIFLYFIGVFVLAAYVSFSDKSQRDEASDTYFLAGRNSTWFVIGASLFASNIGSEHLVGLAGSGASEGVAVAQFEILASFILMLLGWYFAPKYLSSKVSTMPEFLEMRYSKSAKNFLSFITIFSYVLTKISVTIYAGSIIFESVGVPFWTGAFIVVVATGIYTIFGGLKAVLYTDALQTGIILLGSISVLYFGFHALGDSSLSELVPAGHFEIWKPASHPSYPWTGIIFGAPILGIWYWCTDQFIVQRVLSAKNISHARRGTIFAGYLKLLPLFIFVIPGILAYALNAKGVITLNNPDAALSTLIASILPTGIKGLVIAGLLAALMSSLSSVFNSCSTLITYDVYRQFSPNASEKKLVLIGQISTAFLVVLGLMWIPFMKFVSGSLFQYIQSVQAYIAPPIAAIFFLGMYFPKLNYRGALASLGAGFVIGILRLTADINKESLSGLALAFTEINFLHFASLLFVLCTAILFLVSYMSPAPDSKLHHTLFKSKEKEFKDPNKKLEIILSVILILLIFAIWIYFA